MDESRYDREVEEQLAEALPVLGQAALKETLAGLRELLAGCAMRTRSGPPHSLQSLAARDLSRGFTERQEYRHG